MTIADRFRKIWGGLQRFEQAMDYDPLEDMSFRIARLERGIAALQKTHTEIVTSVSDPLSRSDQRVGTSYSGAAEAGNS